MCLCGINSLRCLLYETNIHICHSDTGAVEFLQVQLTYKRFLITLVNLKPAVHQNFSNNCVIIGYSGKVQYHVVG
jgi:hypothetical protein